jgi:murein DD-endopeptidase MepM/ murein hydrolase activator NlpD
MNRRPSLCLVAVVIALILEPGGLSGQTMSNVIAQAYGRSRVEIETARARPGGILGVTVRGGRWSSANTLLDGRRGALYNEGGALFGLVPVPLDTEPFEHKLSMYFPGGRRGGGGSTTVRVVVSPQTRAGRVRTLSPEGLASAASQAALGHARFLLNAIRSRDARGYETRPLQPPVTAPISFPFGGLEDFGVPMGPAKDGLIGEHHRGVDYEVAPGTLVRAPGAGVVLLARSLIFSGETVVIDHGRGLVSVLSHLNYVTVGEGDTVTQGAAVGTSGRTGLGALTPHVCFSVYLHSQNIDPEAVMDTGLWPQPR